MQKLHWTFLIALLLALPFSLSAQEDESQDATPSPNAEEATQLPDTANQMEPPEPIEEERASLWRLQGGGEVVGELVKETPAHLFVDIGPVIIDLPTNSILEKIELSEMTKEDEAQAGQGTGVYDPETGSVVFRSREEGDEILSQQQILENVKKGVVVVSNPAGLGTGWIINEQGELLTNHHVTGNETYQTVTIFVKRGDQWEREKIENCEVKGFSSLLDIAMIQLNMDEIRERDIDLHPLTIAESGALEAGDTVFAVGNPGMGARVLEHTISEGIVSSLQRNFGDVVYLQTTAAVNPGNSGGPLVNQKGEVVGLVTLKAMFQEGVAFALPAEYIHHFLRHTKAYAMDETNQNKGYRYHRPQ